MVEIYENHVYSTAEARQYLKVSSSTLMRLIKKGLIQTARVGKQYRIMGKELLRVVSPEFEDQVGKMYNKGRRWVHEGIDDDIQKQKVKQAGVGVILQARMSSSRLPGKVLMNLVDKPVLYHLINRLLRVYDQDRIVIATSQESSDDPIEGFCKTNGIAVFRGDLNDVTDRFYQAALTFMFKAIVRITGDNPMIEPRYLKAMTEEYLRGEYDYISTKDPHFYPCGTTAEIISFEALEKAWKEGKSSEDREHVTWFVRTQPDRFRVNELRIQSEYTGLPIRLALDDPKDFELLEVLFAKLYGDNPLFGLREVGALYYKHPEIFKINQAVKPVEMSKQVK